jgi:hypothetical protein
MNNTDQHKMSAREVLVLAGVLVVIAVVLALTTVPGIFTIDEDNYMVSVLSLRSGGFEVPGTEGLTRSKELAYFAPQPDRFVVRQRPLSADAPPLYAFFALPFSLFGWPGLFWLNILSFVVTAACVYVIVRRLSDAPLVASLAMAIFVAGGYSVEYAQAVWPHMLSVALCALAFLALAKVRSGDHLVYALLAGLLVGCAAGVREQNVVFGAGLGLGLLVLGPYRIRTLIAYGIGIAFPVLISGYVNYQRIGVFHPVPKSTAYVATVKGDSTGPARARRSTLDPLEVLWTKVVDYSTHPLPADSLEARFFHKEAASGAIMTGTVVKKALLQSCPWIGAALLALLAAWIAINRRAEPAMRELMALSLVIAPVFAMIAYAGYGKTDGISHNQRYLLETVPLLAAAAGLALIKIKITPLHVFLGFVAGVCLAFVVMLVVEPPLRYTMVVYVPIVIGCVLTVGLPLSRWSTFSAAFAVVLGLTVGWSFFVHLTDDVRGANGYRRANLERTRILDSVVPNHSAIVAYGGSKDAAGPLQMHKDVVILDAWADRGGDAPALVGELLARGRRVFVLSNLMPEALIQSISEGREAISLPDKGVDIVEIKDKVSNN